MTEKEMNYMTEQPEVIMNTGIPVLPIDYTQYDPSNIAVWDEYIEIADE